MRQALTASIKTDGDLAVNIDSFLRHLRAENASPNTQKTYREAVVLLARFLQQKGMPQDVAAIRREHLEAFLEDQLKRWKPATANNRFRGLQAFWKWAVEEGELKALLATCEKGQSFSDRRDHALIRVLIDTGARVGEIAELRWAPEDDEADDVDLDKAILRLFGQGRR